MPSKISRNDALADMEALKKITMSSPFFFSLPQDVLFIIFQFLISGKKSVSILELVSKQFFQLVNTNSLPYNLWILCCSVYKLNIIQEFLQGGDSKKKTLMSGMQIRKTVKHIFFSQLLWKEMKLAVV